MTEPSRDLGATWMGVDPARSGSDRTALSLGAKFVTELLPGDAWLLLPDGTIVIANPEHPVRFITP